MINTALKQEQPTPEYFRYGMMQPRLKLATYNIHRCFGTDNRFNPNRISGVIKQLGADIIALQEVESFAEDGRDILNNFGNPGYIAIPGPTIYQRNSTYGNAVLTRHCPASIEKIDISLPNVEPRGAISLVYAFNELRLHVVATHLGLRFRERLFQIELLARTIKRHSADVTVLMGDFNEWLPFGRISRLLPHRFGAAHTGNIPVAFSAVRSGPNMGASSSLYW